MRRDALAPRSAFPSPRAALALCLALLAACEVTFRFDELRDAAEGGAGDGAGEVGVDARDGAEDRGALGACVRDDECGVASLHCDVASGACVECLDDGHCGTTGRPRCDVALHRCVECGTYGDCASGYRCEARTRRCIKTCLTLLDCPAGAHECEVGDGVCEVCERASDCAGTPAAPHCEEHSHLCVECLEDGHCAATRPRCDRVTGTCVECTDASHCGSGLLCEFASGTCVAPG